MSLVADPAPPASAKSADLLGPGRPRETATLERAVIDAAARGPVLAFFATAIGWLLVSTVLGLIVSVKLHSPEFLADIPALTYGRVAPAYNLTLTYGWASLVGMGVGLWLMSRLCRVPIRYPAILAFGVALWNLGLVVGVASVLAGRMNPLPGMEMPNSAAWLMFSGYVLIGIWGAVIYRLRRDSPVYISVWYLLGAFFWFPWVFATAHVLITVPEVSGVMQNIVSAWFSQTLVIYWLTALGLAAAYYLIPKVINRPIYSYNLASIGFWTFAFFGGLTAMVRLSGGPVPAWLVTVSIAASLMMLIPVATVVTNFVFTMRGHTHMVYYSPTVRFTYFGAIAFAIASALSIFTALRSVDRLVRFTPFETGQQHLIIYAFFSMVMFGAIYYITPRLVGCEWLSATLIKMHFWGSAYGGALVISMLIFAGLAVGDSLVDPEATFPQVVQMGQFYTWARTIGVLLFGLAHFIFAFHFLLMLMRIGQPGGEPTLFANPRGAH